MVKNLKWLHPSIEAASYNSSGMLFLIKINGNNQIKYVDCR